MGVIYGVQSSSHVCWRVGSYHIMNTASTAGLLAFPGMLYNVAKRGVVALSETLHHEFAKTALLCLFFARYC